MILPEKLSEAARKNENQNKKFMMRFKARLPKDLDSVVLDLHLNVFDRIDCLECANCCKTLGPRITEKDIARISKYLIIKKDVFTRDFIKIDEDGDYVFKSMPCPFLLPDNSCSVYEVRPKACQEYPHTDRRKFHQILNLTLKNTFVCPAVFEIIEKLKEIYNH
jgi:uncharacterized protein